jgi:hypothetical protein
MKYLAIIFYVFISFGAGANVASRAGQAGEGVPVQVLLFVGGAVIWPVMLGVKIMVTPDTEH